MAFLKTLGRKRPASESMGRTEGNDVYEYSPADFEMRPEAGPMASSIPISEWQVAVRKPDNPPAPSALTGMMSLKDSTKHATAQRHIRSNSAVLGR